MVRFKENAIVIEIPSSGYGFEDLARYQGSLTKLLRMLPSEYNLELNQVLYDLSFLLEAMQYDEDQAMALSNLISKAPKEFKAKFLQ